MNRTTSCQRREPIKISALELYHVSIPLRETFWPTWIPGYPPTHNRFNLIKIVTDEGIEGYSAGAELNYGRDEIKIMLEKDCFDIYQPDATFAGGIAQVRQIMTMCRQKERLT